LKRSNRLILLIGVFLAIVAFAGVIYVMSTTTQTSDHPTTVPTTANIVVATQDIPLSSKITADMVTTKEVPIADKLPNGYADTSYVIGLTVRKPVLKDQAITTDVTQGTNGTVTDIDVPAGKVAIAMQVDQVSGVGTVIKSGDYIDMVVALTGAAFPVVTVNPTDQSVTVVSGLNSTSVKLLLQGGQVLGTLLPPAPPATGNNAAPPTNTGTTTLNGQQEIVLVAVTAQQAEVIKYAQVEGNISLVLRSADDFLDPVTKLPLDPTLIVPATTTGITLKSLVDDYGVLVPQLVESIIPTASPGP
jgi:pilus assembly protein CpaB